MDTVIAHRVCGGLVPSSIDNPSELVGESDMVVNSGDVAMGDGKLDNPLDLAGGTDTNSKVDNLLGLDGETDTNSKIDNPSELVGESDTGGPTLGARECRLPRLPMDSGTLNYSTDDVSRNVGTKLADRWNAGVQKFVRVAGLCFSLLFVPTLPSLQTLVRPPPARDYGDFDLTVLGSPPPYLPLGEWTPSSVLEHLPSGGPGPDGISTDDIQNLNDDGLNALVMLLTLADEGRLPTFWTQARTTLIPKPDSADRRPITVMSVCYRLWGKRHSKSLTTWLASWCPKSVRGAMPGSGAADVATELTLRIDQTRAKLKSSMYLMSLDQSQCFDRIGLVNLLKILDVLDLQICFQVVENYSNLVRHVFTDGQPSDIFIEGDEIAGIPQGCPFATFLCNLQGVIWILSVQRETSASATTFLDDWICEGKSWTDLESVWAITLKLMKAFGPYINVGKSCIATISGLGPKPCEPPEALKDIRLLANFKYLGVDILCDRSTGARPTATKRRKAFVHRLTFVRSIPFMQRSALVMDACSSLYMAAGNTYTQKSLNTMVSKAADAFASFRSSGAKSRSKAMVHLVGPGTHLTHPPACSIFSSIRQVVRLIAKGELPKDDYVSLWHRKYKCRSSLLKAISFALKFLKVQWTAPFVLKLGDQTFSFDLENYTTKLCNKMWHELRDFLRLTVVAKEAQRRPKDYAGLEHGWDDRHGVRANTYSLWHRRTGPSLLCAAVWTRARIYKVNRAWTDTPVCVRCNKKVETLWHRLFQCSCNKDFFDHHLTTAGITLDDIKTLPAATTRCCLFAKDSGWSIDKVCALQDYMVAVNVAATAAYDAFRKGIEISELKIDIAGKSTALAPESIYSLAIPPLKRKKKVDKSEKKDTFQKSATWSCLPDVIPERPPTIDGRTWLYTDGSYTPEKNGDPIKCGWGFCALTSCVGPVIDMCGPVDIHGPLAELHSATDLSNNVGELCAILHALCWASHHQHLGSITIAFDSDYAMNTIKRNWRPKTNIPLVLMCRRALACVESYAEVDWYKVVSHTGVRFNERADHLADCGANGLRHYTDEVMIFISQGRPPDLS